MIKMELVGCSVISVSSLVQDEQDVVKVKAVDLWDTPVIDVIHLAMLSWVNHIFSRF